MIIDLGNRGLYIPPELVTGEVAQAILNAKLVELDWGAVGIRPSYRLCNDSWKMHTISSIHDIKESKDGEG